MGTPEPAVYTPVEPETLEQTGLPESLIEQLILKILYFRGDVYGQDLSKAICLKFSVIQDIVEMLKLRHQVQVKRSMGMGNVGAQLTLTEAGRARAREHLDSNQYAGPAPVPAEQYAEVVRRQKPQTGWLSKDALRKAFRGMVITERLLSQVGPAVSAANSLLLYGKPGDGKTFLVESLNNLDTAAVYLPHAIECQGKIIQVFDPIYHQPLEEEAPSVLAVAIERTYDRRWVQCKRPFIVSGGELTLDMLDLRYNETSKVYEAPFQLKANNGIYLVDDFGRQRATPQEVLNRWIVPMERRVDYLSLTTGGKVTVPFETFLVFSTNLNPAELGDEAFLRRIQYKLLLQGPQEAEFIRIFENFCAARRIPCPAGLAAGILEKHYKRTGRPLRRCHPRDVLSHALNLIHFERQPLQLNTEILDRAFESCFVQEDEAEAAAALAPAALAPAHMASCGDYWGDRLAQIPTAFGSLAFIAGFRDRIAETYVDNASAREYGEMETERALAKLHAQCFREWQELTAEQQKRDFACFLSYESNSSFQKGSREELVAGLTPAGVMPEESEEFSQGLSGLLDAAFPPAIEAPAAEVCEEPLAVQKIA